MQREVNMHWWTMLIAAVLGFVLALFLAAASVSAAQSAAGVPPEVVEFWTYLIGNWDMKGQIGSKPVEGVARFEWADGKHSYVGQQSWTFDDGRTIQLAQLVGWDAAEKATVEQGFSTTGEAARAAYKPPSSKGDVIQGIIRGVDCAGLSWAGDVNFEVIRPDKFRLTATVDGELVHSLTYVRKQHARKAIQQINGPSPRD